MESSREKTSDWYTDYYARKGNDRNDLLTNPEVLFQHLALEDAVISTLRKAEGLNRTSSRILDVGCGSAASLARFLQLGFSPDQLCGIDVLADRIAEASRKYPNIRFVCDDASSMPFGTGEFDFVLESTMFVQITDDHLAQGIASEMLRVTSENGHILLIDWRYDKPGNASYKAVSRKRIERLVGVGSSSDIVWRANGSLVPPVGRPVSAYVPSLYFLLRAIFPFLSGLKTTLLRKRVT
jgi:ubiquinone/menaquinone biosynthesis C-methylase UbiE